MSSVASKATSRDAARDESFVSSRWFRTLIAIGAVLVAALLVWQAVVSFGAPDPVASRRSPVKATLDIAVLVLELAISVGIGALMGAIATFRPLTADDRVRDPRAQWASRTGGVGIVLWVTMIAVRIGIDVLAGMAGSHLAASTGVILLVFAANRAGRAITMGAWLQKLARASA